VEYETWTRVHARRVPVEAFLMDRYEVDDVRMARFLEETGNPPPLLWENQASVDRAAVHSVDWFLARDYCAWAGGRLPRSLEWEWAAMGPEGFDFPWGNAPPSKTRANFAHGESNSMFFFARVKPVGTFPAGASPFGVHDMAGNVTEWVQERSVDPVSEARRDDPGDVRVVRGGDWATPADLLPSWWYRRYPAATRDQTHGFRCVRDLELR